MAAPPDKRVDCLGLYCPMPILKIREAVRALEPGEVVEMLSDDPASEADMKSWSARSGHELLSIDRDGRVFRFVVRKNGRARG